MKVKEYDINSIIKFGRFNGKKLSEVVSIKADYIEWCIVNLDHFYISDETINELVEINSEFKVTDHMREILEEKSEKISRRNKGDSYDERPTYGKYAGSYAQDYEGLSDNFIDDVLDGFEDAYWNID